MKVTVIFKADNGFKPYCSWGSAAYKFCHQFGPTLKTAFIGGVNPIYLLPEKINVDIDLTMLFQILGSSKSIRVAFCAYDRSIELTVPGYREEWVVGDKND